MRAELSSRGYVLGEPTRAKGMSLDDIRLGPPAVEIGPLGWAEYLHYLEILGAPAGLLSGADPSAVHLLVARRAGGNVATALASVTSARSSESDPQAPGPVLWPGVTAMAERVYAALGGGDARGRDDLADVRGEARFAMCSAREVDLDRLLWSHAGQERDRMSDDPTSIA